ncbi:MAG TPA: immunoglobulin domain-containing protein [Verrucomicrobiae bacterium]|nr:immunoglobulin domain-containing protein [Verrucomicrobiae bacterium]
MKFRVLTLGLAILAGNCFPGRAQQLQQPFSYSLNLGAGWNAIANPLIVGSNTLDELFPIVPDGSALAKFNRAVGGYETNTYDAFQRIWLTSAGAPGGKLNPGEGAFLNVRTAVSLVVAGMRATPHALVDAGFGPNLVGCQALEPCSFEELMGFAPRPGDVVYQYDRPLPNLAPAPETGATKTNRFGTAGWDVEPLIPGTKGVFVVLANRPRLMVDPLRLNVPLNGMGKFTAVPLNASGDSPTALQWRFQGNPIPGQTGLTLTLSSVQPSNAGNYSVVAQFASGPVTSLNARLTIVLPPLITKQPQSLTVTQGQTAVFSVQASGTLPLYYQWMRDPLVVLPFALDRTSLVISNAGPQDAGVYRVIVTNLAGNVSSTQAVLNVLTPPFIRVHPVSQMVNPNSEVILSVVAEGTGPLVFQWLLNGNPIAGATGPSLTLSRVQPDQSGAYRVIVSNPAGAVVSEVAFVRVVTQELFMSDRFPGLGFIDTPRGIAESSNTLATLEPGEPRHAEKRGGHSVWVNFFAPGPGIMTLRTRGSSFDTLLAAYLGNDLTNLMEVASDDDGGGFLSSSIRFSAQANVPYHIVVAGHGDSSGRVVLSWDFEPTADILPIFAQQPKSQVVPVGGMAVFSVNLSVPPDGLQWFFNGTAIQNATQPMLLVPDAQITNVGLYGVSVRLGGRIIDSQAAELELREIDGAGQPPALRAQDKYEDLVDALLQSQISNLKFQIHGGAGFIPASQVLGYTGSETFTTVGSGGQNGEPVHCGVVGGHSKWYAYIPPTDGTLFLNTDGSNFDTLLAAYTGCCTFNSLTPVACDNNSGTNGLASALSFEATSNTVYYVAVDGVGGVTGAARLNYRLLVPMVLTNLAKTSNSMAFLVKATPSWPVTIQHSTNCVSWTNVFTTGTVSGTFTFQDTNLPFGRHFYRSMQSP